MSNGNARNRVVLVVLDGWGYTPAREGNAIELASTPVWHRLWDSSPRTLLEASGLAVGLPEGQMGNSEVGHLNVGAGRVVPQDLVRISQSIQSGEFYQLPPLVQLCTGLRETGGTLHLVGLLGPGGVHALDRHLLACVELGMRHRVPAIAIHGFLDGRDSSPTLGAEVVRTLLQDMRRIAGDRVEVASLTGRYYGMDRDRRWERTKLAYDAMVHGVGTPVEHPVLAVLAAYHRGETDEFIRPLVHYRNGVPVATMRDGDGILFFNYRSDRMRQIVSALALDGFEEFDPGHRPDLACVTMTQYDQNFPLSQAFPPFSLARILAEVLAEHGRTQLRTAETEKYPHVTYFFNGGYEPPYAGEERCLVPSQRVATYDLAPEMSAAGITDALCRNIERGSHDFILCNFANADMVGHTGVLPAVVRAVETLDLCLARVLASAEQAGVSVLITADHGNCEMMIDPITGGVHTAHTTNPVPFVAVGTGAGALRTGGALRDVAPTVLHLLGIHPPAEMSGRDLREC
ncbi:MAG: 2,3-bisphosphoglycerate-independent phosphoglycerate mutase [Gemmatimonadales bacterium]|nr:2,3-bisphosphoglycerate-independent phosphoglycerate mutase [Gemmatimonadales bacterium]MDQ3427317.1 2,3-bisphosphoglycerate-independent phosphoglycerate mutase [Gemmatimonadota bacterium]